MLRNIRPAGYLGIAMTFGLPWAVLAALLAHSSLASAVYILAYLTLRLTMAWTIAVWGLGDPVVRKKIWLVPLRDALSFLVWTAGFFSSKVSWRGKEYLVKESCLIALPQPSTQGVSNPSGVATPVRAKPTLS